MTVVIHGKTGIYKNKLILKRIIATGGQRVKILKGDVFVNGQKLNKDNINIIQIIDKDGKQIGMTQKETTSNGNKSYTIMKQDLSGASEMDNIEFTVPENHIFVLGDNRDRSADSRVVGFIHENDVIGIGVLRIISIDSTQLKSPSNLFRLDRFFTKIQ
jgi:signal peptidase I